MTALPAILDENRPYRCTKGNRGRRWRAPRHTAAGHWRALERKVLQFDKGNTFAPNLQKTAKDNADANPAFDHLAQQGEAIGVHDLVDANAGLRHGFGQELAHGDGLVGEDNLFSVQIGQPDFAQLRHRVVQGCDRVGPPAQGRERFDLGRGRKVVAKPDVDITLLQALDDLSGVLDLDREIQAGVVVLHVPQNAGQKVRGQHFVHAKTQVTALHSLKLVNLVLRDGQFIDDRSAAKQEDLSGFGQFQTAATAISAKKLYIQRELEVLDLFADRRGRHMQSVCRSTERSLLSNFNEMSQTGQATEDGARRHQKLPQSNGHGSRSAS